MEKSSTVILFDTANQVRKSIIKLLKNTKTIEVFDDINACVDYIFNAKEDKIFFITNATDAEITIPLLDDSTRLDSIFILCPIESKNEPWLLKHPKVKGIFKNIMGIFEHIDEVQYGSGDILGFDVVNTSSISSSTENDKKNKQEVMFMYGQLIKEILTRLPYSTIDINNMFEYFFVKYIDEPRKIEEFTKFEREYKQHSPIWWYSKEFLYSSLNTALRIHDISTLYPMGIFIRDLHEQIVQLHTNSSDTNIPTLYRGQLIPSEDFEKIKMNSGGLLSFNSFLSTTRDRAVAEMFAGESNNDSNKTPVLIQINIDSSIQTPASFANIESISNFGESEQEYLFTMGSIFRIESVKKSNTSNLWYVTLKLTNDNDPDLIRLTASFRSILISKKLNYTHICSLAMLMMIMDEGELATEILETVLTSYNDPVERFKIYYTLGTLYTNLNDSQKALKNYEKVVNSYVLRFLPINVIAMIYYGLGELCMIQKKFKLALINVEIALGIELIRRPQPDGRQLAHYYHTIGQIHANLGNNNEALTYYNRAIEIATKCFPSHHPLIAKCMISRSSLLYHENRLEEISLDFNKASQIMRNSLSTNHGMQVFTHMTNAKNFYEKSNWSGALASYQAALKCSHQHISSTHPNNAPILWGIASTYMQQNQFDEALSILQEALNIQTAALPSNHPNIAITNTLFANVLERQGDSSALSYYQQALDIQLKCLPSTHPDIRQTQQAISRLQRRYQTNQFQ